jgi:class I fructose-bisphosphate aldolase
MSKDELHLPGPTFIDDVMFASDRSPTVLRNLQTMFDHGRLFGSVEQAFGMGAVAVGATIYFGSPESRRQIEEISEVFEHAHELGLFTVLWAYLRNEHFEKDSVDYETSADLTGQANHLAVTIEADIVKQKQPTNNGGYEAIGFGKTHRDAYLDKDITVA